MSKRLIISIIVCLTSILPLFARDTFTGSKDERLRTLRVRHTASDALPPVVLSGADEAIDISFDILAEEPEYLRWRLVHCNADWQPSTLTDNDILDGFNEGVIEDVSYSDATTVHYIHYRFRALDGPMRPKFPGNYLVEIYSENDPGKVLAQARTAITDGELNISGDVSGVTDIDYNDRHQQLRIMIDDRDRKVENLYTDLILTVTQNGREDLVRTIRHPLRAQGQRAIYEHLGDLIFEGGNEFRRFETVSTYFPPLGIESVSFYDPYYRFLINEDLPKSSSQYLYDRTQQGKFTIRNADLRESSFDESSPRIGSFGTAHDTGADYGVVYFRLKSPQMLGKVHLIGEFTGLRPDADNEMDYNPAEQRYEKAFLLKQGAYDYEYVCEGSDGKISNCIDGNHHETRNRYEVRVYQRRRSERADRLIGVGVIDSF